MNSLQRELQTLTEQIEEQDDLLRPLEKEVEKAEKKAAKECERDDATMLGKEIWKELDGLSDDLQECRNNAATALRAASRQVSTKRLRVRLRLSGRIVKEPKQIHVVTSKGQRAAVEAIVQASHELDACKDVGAYARRSMRRLQQCAKNRIKVVESQLPGPLPAKPQIADAEAAFASAGLKTPDAVEDCLVCWDFMTTFRTARGVCSSSCASRRWRRGASRPRVVFFSILGRFGRRDGVLRVSPSTRRHWTAHAGDSPVLPARDDNSFLMLPETRLDEFAAALQASNDELVRRPEQHNPFRYLAHVHKELLKLIMTDEETDRWWPSPKKSYGPRWWARPELPQKPQPLLQRFEAVTPHAPSRIMCQIGAIQATGQPVPVPLLALALQELRYPQPVVDACSQGHPLGQEILLKVGRAAQDAHRAAQTNGAPRTGQASAEELAAFRAFQDSKRAQQAAQDSPPPPPPAPAPAPAAPPGPPSAEELKLREELEALKRENAKLKTPAGAVAGAAACAEGALAACGKAARKAKKVSSSCNSKAAKTAVEPQQPTRVSARARRKAPPRNEIGFESTPKTRGNNGRRAPGSGLPGGRAKPLNAAQRAALPLHLNDLLQLLKHDAGTRDCPRFPPAVVGSTTWAPLAAAACARIADYAAATSERCGAYDEWGGLEGDIVVHQRPGGGDDATRQGWSPAHRQQFFDPYKEDPESVDEPSTAEPACVVRDPLNGKTALREACASLLRGEPYGDLDPSQRCALLRTLIDAALQTKIVTEEVNKRATKIANAESSIWTKGQKTLQDDNMRCRRRAQDSRRDLNIPAPPKTSTAVIDDEGGFFAAARLAELDASSARGLLRCRLEEHRDAECLSLLDETLKRCAIYDEAPYLVDHVDPQRNASALKLIEDASKQMDVERLRNALLTARRLPGLASPLNLDPNHQAWVLRPLAVGALLLRDLEYDANVCKKIKSDEADLRALPSLRAEPVGRDKTGNCHWAFRGEREYRYAPQRVWVQQSPDHDVQQKPSWGYYGDATAVAALCRHLDRNDESEALLRDKLLLRVPPGVAEWRE